MASPGTILITGAGSGIGRACAALLAAQGAPLRLLDRDGDALARVAESLLAGSSGPEPDVRTAVADISRIAEVRDAVARLAEGGGLDGVVANAGINGVWAPIDDLRPEEWDRTVAVNLTGTYNTLHVAVPHLKARGGGSVVIVSSMNGTRIFTTAGATAYVATKAGQLAMGQQLALELARHRIRVNVVCPGQVATGIGESTTRRNTEAARIPVHWPEGDIPLLPPGEVGRAEDVAEAVAFLLSGAARHVTGTPVWVDGGQSLLR